MNFTSRVTYFRAVLLAIIDCCSIIVKVNLKVRGLTKFTWEPYRYIHAMPTFFFISISLVGIILSLYFTRKCLRYLLSFFKLFYFHWIRAEDPNKTKTFDVARMWDFAEWGSEVEMRRLTLHPPRTWNCSIVKVRFNVHIVQWDSITF